MQLVYILAVVAGSSVLTDGGVGIQSNGNGKGLVEVSMSLWLCVVSWVLFFTLRCLGRQLSRRGSGLRNWGRRGVERKEGGGGGTGEGEKVRRELL